jgi:hypothetical protein
VALAGNRAAPLCETFKILVPRAPVDLLVSPSGAAESCSTGAYQEVILASPNGWKYLKFFRGLDASGERLSMPGGDAR